MQALQIDSRHHGGLRLSGELDLSTAPQLSNALMPMVARGGDVVIDLAAVSFIDGSGLRPLLLAAHQLEGRGCVVLRAPSRPAARLLDVLHAKEFRNIVITEWTVPSRTRVISYVRQL